MTRLHKCAGYLLAMMLGAVASTALAHDDDEKYGLKVVTAATPGQYTATITNFSDDDDIKSFRIAAPTGWTLSNASITGGTGYDLTPTRVPATSPFPAGTTSVTFKDVKIGKYKTAIVTLTAAQGTSSACGTSSHVWDSTAWEYSSASGDTFKRTSSLADRTTSITTACQYSVSIAATTLYRGTAKSLTATVTNLAQSGGPTLGSITLTPPADITTAQTTYAVNLAGGASTQITIAATAPCEATDAADAWTTTAVTAGFTLSGSAPSQGVTGQCKLEFTQVPAAVANSIPSEPIAVKLYDGQSPRQLVTGTGTIAAGSVTLSTVAGSQCTLAAPLTSPSSAAFPVTFSGVVFSTAATGSGCTLGAAWSDADVLSGQSTVIPVAAVVNSGDLACGETPVTGNTFDASTSTATAPDDPGFFAGYRAPPYKADNCNPVKWVATNNIGGNTVVYDFNGYKLDPNTASIVYANDAGGVLLAHTITFAPEAAGSDGFPDPTRKNKYCDTGPGNAAKDCTVGGGFLLDAVACSSPTINVNSIPGWSGGLPGPGAKPGCIRGSAWAIAPASSCTGAYGCVQVSIDVLEARDPPWAR